MEVVGSSPTGSLTFHQFLQVLGMLEHLLLFMALDKDSSGRLEVEEMKQLALNLIDASKQRCTRR